MLEVNGRGISLILYPCAPLNLNGLTKEMVWNDVTISGHVQLSDAVNAHTVVQTGWLHAGFALQCRGQRFPCSGRTGVIVVSQACDIRG